MSGWIKYFTDGTIENGSDIRVEKGLVSWSKGKLDGLYATSCNGFGYSAAIIGASSGEFHQSEDFDVEVFSSISIPVCKRLQYRVTAKHTGMFIAYGPKKTILYVMPYYPATEAFLGFVRGGYGLGFKFFYFNPDMVGQWVTIQVSEKGINWDIEYNKI